MESLAIALGLSPKEQRQWLCSMICELRHAEVAQLYCVVRWRIGPAVFIEMANGCAINLDQLPDAQVAVIAQLAHDVAVAAGYGAIDEEPPPSP